MVYKHHYVIATYIGNRKNFIKGKPYLLRIEYRPTGIFPICIVYDYAQYYKEEGYESMFELLDEWSEIITVVDTEVIKKNAHTITAHDNELPFKDDEDIKENKSNVCLSSKSLENNSAKECRTQIEFSNGSWICPACKKLNQDSKASKCKFCGENKLE